MYAQDERDQSTPPAPPPPSSEQVQQLKVHVLQGTEPGFLIKRVQPKYPKEARKNRVQGAVVLQARISKTGDVADLRVISGDELLVPAAIKAVQQWKYKPYTLKGEPIEVQTRITLNFTLH